MKLSDLKDEHGNLLRVTSWQLSPDMHHVLIQTDHVKQWRYSGWGNYYIHTLADGTTRAVIPPTNPPTISYAVWSPVGEALAFVSSNDLYVMSDPSMTVPIRVTSTGNHSFFNGVPDWVYEEEVYNSAGALWWSPDATRIAYLVTNDDGVRDFEYQVFNKGWTADTVQAYPDTMKMPYPKPGTPNPVVSVQVFDLSRFKDVHPEPPSVDAVDAQFVKTLEWEEMRDREESIIQEVAWVGNEELMVKETNRGADDGVVVYVDLRSSTTTYRVARRLGKNGEQGDEGWIEPVRERFALMRPVSR
ncbi:peptidase S9B [Exidia glandulosa HHB12029]|uniref:Peptidase S9B n=1 Tax=Exidia glandulosa HHB12029 TaxID=1314781 RepID=A0A166MAS8_EXIGL|nr:peptidase S9B [Exidia glandulosa HHB12029]